VLDGLGLILVVTSYLDMLSISATAAHEAVPDLARLMAGIRASYDELKHAVAPGRGGRQPAARKTALAGKALRKKAGKKGAHVAG
jgi:hypothetical protein